ncbi:MAG: hypothetical protein ACKO96_44365, partial [Flammeovirgaceae bacterium]
KFYHFFPTLFEVLLFSAFHQLRDCFNLINHFLNLYFVVDFRFKLVLIQHLFMSDNQNQIHSGVRLQFQLDFGKFTLLQLMA